MKQKFKSQYVLSLVASTVMVYLLLLVPHSAYAANLTWEADTTITFTGLSNLTLTIKAGSTASAFTLGATSASVTIATGETFTVEDSNIRHIANSYSSYVTACPGALTRVVFNIGGTYTFNPTSSSPACPPNGGSPSPAVNNIPPPVPPVEQKPVETPKVEETKVEQKPAEVPVADVTKSTDQNVAPKAKPMTGKEIAAAAKEFAKAKKDLKSIAGDNKVSAKEKPNFGLAVAKVNAKLASLKVAGVLDAGKIANLKAVPEFLTNLDKLETAQAAAKKVTTKIAAFFKNDGKLSKAEVAEAKKLLKAAGVTNITQIMQTKNSATLTKKVSDSTAKVVAKALKTLQQSLTKLTKLTKLNKSK